MPEVLSGCGPRIEPIPEAAWWADVQGHMPAARRRFEVLPALHRAVRRTAVLSLARTQLPVPARAIAGELGAPLGQVEEAIADLERALFFLVRDEAGRVSWAFPITSDETQHRLTFSSGERLYGA